MQVVCINANQSNFTHYIGRKWAGLPESPFHNPFHIGKDGNRIDVLRKFVIYWYAPEQMALRQLAVKTLPPEAILGCWCHPAECHGHIIAAYVKWKREQTESPLRLFE
jgi:hypothetical protein